MAVSGNVGKKAWPAALALALAPATAAAEGQLPVFGYLEDALLMPQGFPIKAKLDTGADNSSVNARVVRDFERDGKKWIAFVIESLDGRQLELERPILRTARIKRHEGMGRALLTTPRRGRQADGNEVATPQAVANPSNCRASAALAACRP